MDRVCESDTLSFLTKKVKTKKAQGQGSRTPGEVIHLKVIFTETRETWKERRGIQPYRERRMDDGWNKHRLQLKTNGNISFPLSQIGFILPEFVAWLPLIALLISKC